MKKFLTAIISIFFSILATGVSLYAQETDAPDGTQEETFVWMLQEWDPLYSAMGGASYASSKDIAYSALRNPAVIPFSEGKFGVGASYLKTSGTDGNSISAGVGGRLGKRVGLALAGNYNNGEEYELIDDFGNRNGTFKPSSMLFSAGIGVKVIDFLSVGVNLKYVSERLAQGDNIGAFASDIYAMYRWKGLGVSAGVANVGTKVKDENDVSFKLPSSARVGVNYIKDLTSMHLVEANLDLDYSFNGKFSAAIGTQYGFKESVFVRAGYRYSQSHSSVPSYASVGLGFGFAGVKLNAVYLIATGDTPSRNTVSVGLEYCF